jgi:hypothetical protein
MGLSGSKPAFAAVCVPDVIARCLPACLPARSRAGPLRPAGRRLSGVVAAGHRGEMPGRLPSQRHKIEQNAGHAAGQNWRYPPLMTRDHGNSRPAAPGNRGITGRTGRLSRAAARMTRDHSLIAGAGGRAALGIWRGAAGCRLARAAAAAWCGSRAGAPAAPPRAGCADPAGDGAGGGWEDGRGLPVTPALLWDASPYHSLARGPDLRVASCRLSSTTVSIRGLRAS